MGNKLETKKRALSMYARTSGSVDIITRNRSEYLFLHSMCEEWGWLTPLLTEPEKFPFVFCLDFDRKTSAWTDRLDRNLRSVEFTDWITQNDTDEARKN